MRRPRTRREFLGAAARGLAVLPAARLLSGIDVASAARRLGPAPWPVFPDAARGWRGESSVAAALRAGQRALTDAVPPPAPAPVPLAERFADLSRHFVFEYYPWYAADPYRHWEQWDRVPPDDIAARYVPRLGAYDSRSKDVLERHAAWIADSRAGAVNLSWWGPGSFEDAMVPLVMDVMRDHGLKVAFHVEPYADDHARHFADDILYLLREYGEKRRFDALLVLRDADGTEGPVFKGFRTILPERVVDCHGVTRQVPDFADDDTWSRQTNALRRALRQDFDHVTLLADSLDFDRTEAAGFDGIAIYDNFVEPSSYAAHAAGASERGLVFSFNVNPGYDSIEPRSIEPGSCYAPAPFAPPTPDVQWDVAGDRERAAQASAARIGESLEATVRVQGDPTLSNGHRGFFLAYVNSWNEWHEGHAFEPMQDGAALTAQEWVFGYHNPLDGGYRVAALKTALAPLLSHKPQPAAVGMA